VAEARRSSRSAQRESVPAHHGQASIRRVGALNCCEEWPRSVTAAAPQREPRTVVIIGVVAVGSRSHQSIASALAVMRSRRPAVNLAWVAPTVGEAELPQFCGGAVVVVDRLIHGIGVDLAGLVAVDRRQDVAEQFGQLCLVVDADPFPRAPLGLVATVGRCRVPARPGAGRWSGRLLLLAYELNRGRCRGQTSGADRGRGRGRRDRRAGRDRWRRADGIVRVE
jgi:hypothetical protein